MNAAAFQSLSSKLHALWADLDDDERRLLALATNSGEGPEVEGFAAVPAFAQLLPPTKAMTYGDIDFDVVSPRDPASGLPTGVRKGREAGSGLATG